MSREYQSPLMEREALELRVDEQEFVDRAEELEEEFRRLLASQVGKQALIQASVPELFISNQEKLGQPPVSFIETSIARIALGSFL